MNERERAVHFYEMLTGVFNDEQSKIIRYVCFAVLFAGILWAGFNYFRASILADTKKPLDPDMFQDTALLPRNDTTLQRIADLAQTVDSMRGAGAALAAAMDRLHSMPFNIDPEGGTLDPFGASGTGVSNIPSAPAQTAPRAAPLTVKMIIMAKDGEKLAVVDIGEADTGRNETKTERSLIVRQGDELPNEGGYVSAIRDDGITVIFNKEELKYDIAEIPKYDGIRKPGGKSRRPE